MPNKRRDWGRGQFNASLTRSVCWCYLRWCSQHKCCHHIRSPGSSHAADSPSVSETAQLTTGGGRCWNSCTPGQKRDPQRLVAVRLRMLTLWRRGPTLSCLAVGYQRYQLALSVQWDRYMVLEAVSINPGKIEAKMCRSFLRSPVVAFSLQGGPKTDTLCFVRLNFIEYWPIFTLISLSESGEHL